MNNNFNVMHNQIYKTAKDGKLDKKKLDEFMSIIENQRKELHLSLQPLMYNNFEKPNKGMQSDAAPPRR